MHSKLTKLGRTIMSALIVMEVHARDMVTKMLEEGVRNVNDYSGKFSPGKNCKRQMLSIPEKIWQINFCACPPVLILFNVQLSLNCGREPARIIESEDHSGLMPLLPFIDHLAVARLLIYEDSGLHSVAGHNLRTVWSRDYSLQGQ